MAKKKFGSKATPLRERADETTGTDRQTEPPGAGLVPTAAPRMPAAVAREKLLRAIAREATAISKAKHKGRSDKALKTLAHAYALVATEETHTGPDAPARTGSGSGGGDGKGLLPSMRTAFLVKGKSTRKGKHDGD
ncbi:hypothetical protein A6A06_27675 [Streptomyces sp. CB02923]|uniref:hypothetical protein n=1 Tax=Streptomyces sp. CB02923 TaxID=1718985 RepID=UPI00093F34CE|nr:hypothetical protein [Streptomyces sp. CB02923]OKH99321.1 hypothetical protein A6A06_27675 [Streptomyces sp. CB02923]